MENTFHAFLTLKGKRLTGSFGSMHGLKVEKAVPDEMLSDDIPYLEMLYRFVFGEKRSYYDLQVTKDVNRNEAQAGERAELGGASTTPDERYSAGASWVERECCQFEGSQNGTFATTLSKDTQR